MDTHVANENKKDEDKKIISFFKILQRLFLYLYEGKAAVLTSFPVQFSAYIIPRCIGFALSLFIE